MICLPASTESLTTLGKLGACRLNNTTGRCSASSSSTSSGKRLPASTNPLDRRSQPLGVGSLELRIFLRVAEDEGVAGRPGLRLGTADRPKLRGFVMSATSRASIGMPPVSEGRYHPVVPVAQSHRDALHVPACRRADPVGVSQGTRGCRHGDPGFVGHILQGDRSPFAAIASGSSSEFILVCLSCTG